MNDTERVLGKLEQFAEYTEKRLDAMDVEHKKEFASIREDIAGLNTFKVKVTAYAFVAVIVAKVLIELVTTVLAKV